MKDDLWTMQQAMLNEIPGTLSSYYQPFSTPWRSHYTGELSIDAPCSICGSAPARQICTNYRDEDGICVDIRYHWLCQKCLPYAVSMGGERFRRLIDKKNPLLQKPSKKSLWRRIFGESK